MRDGQSGWFASLLGAAVLMAGGFTLGLVAGVVSEEPELVVGHLVGRSDEVTWLPDAEPELTAPALGEMRSLDARTASRALSDRLGDRVGDGRDDVAVAPAVEPLTVARREQDLPAVAAGPAERAASAGRLARLAPADAPATQRPAAAAAPRSGFAVQVGAFADPQAAAEVQHKLEDRGFDSYVIPASQSGDGKWRVRVGPVPSREGADSLAARLKSQEKLPTWVLPEGGS